MVECYKFTRILACTSLLALYVYMLYEHVYFNCYMRHRTDSVFVQTLSCSDKHLLIFLVLASDWSTVFSLAHIVK